MLNNYPMLLTVNEVSDILLVGKNTVYDLINDGKIQAFRTGTRTWKIKKESLVNYICTESHLI